MGNNKNKIIAEDKCGLCQKEGCSCGVDLGLLLIRLGLAAVFIYHGWGKLSSMENTIKFFAMKGLPSFLAYLVAVGEFLGGLSMLFGVFARWAGYGLAIIMLGAIIKIKLMAGVPFSNGWEFDLVLLCMALAVSFAGTGRYSLWQITKQK